MTSAYLAPFGTPAPIRLEYDRLVRVLADATRLPPWHLTFDTPSTPTRQDSIVNPTTPAHADDYNNCPACETGRFAPDATPTEETPVTETSPAVQYGTKKNGVVRWPDEDNELRFDIVDGAPYGGYVSAADLPALQAVAKRNGVALVRRSLTYGPVEDVKPPLPTTPGSVVRATVAGSTGCILGLTNDGDDEPWRDLADGSDYYGVDDLTDVTVIFDAGAAA